MFYQQALLGALLAVLTTGSAIADLAIIGNKQADVGSLDALSVKRLFLGERQSFPNGLKAVPVNHAVGSPDRKEFFDNVLGMSESTHKRHWNRMRSTGRGDSPAELSSYQTLLHWIAENPNGIGYINASEADDSVKVLLTIKAFDSI